jgi:cell wall-associated NlpC family hydrolase
VVNYTDHAEALTLRHGLFELAKDQLGSRYVYGSSRPGAFDCSGLTYYLYRQYGIDIHRTASTQLQDGIVVSRDGLQVGDLIFFRSGGYYVGHVGIYVGNGQIIHAGNGGVGYAELDSSWFARNYLCARRIVTVSAQTISSAGSCLTSNAETGLRTAK